MTYSSADADIIIFAMTYFWQSDVKIFATMQAQRTDAGTRGHGTLH